MAKPGKIDGLDCDLVAADGIRVAITSRFTETTGFKNAALTFEDPDGVHDMRVASRRLRSALKDLRPFVLKGALKKIEEKITEIADALGAVRDQDVLIEILEKLLTRCPADVAPGIRSLVDERKERRRIGREALRILLSSRQFEDLSPEFEQEIERATVIKSEKKSRGDDQPGTFREMGVRILFDRISELNELSANLFEPFRRKRLHRLRIAAKRLRYSLQLFADCLPEGFNNIVEPISKLQKALGDLHDADVFIAELGFDLANTRSESNPNVDFKQVSDSEVWLLGEFVKLRTSYYLEAVEEWQCLKPRLVVSFSSVE